MSKIYAHLKPIEVVKDCDLESFTTFEPVGRFSSNLFRLKAENRESLDIINVLKIQSAEICTWADNWVP